MKKIIILIALLPSFTIFGQSIREMTPIIGYLVDRSLEGELDFIQKQEDCERFWKEVGTKIDQKDYTPEQQKLFDYCATDVEGYWDIIGVGCSWYCGGGLDTLSASSELNSFKSLSYSVKNIHDLSYKTAWIEGVPGYGIGEYVTYHIPPQSPRITEIIVVNGYVKSEKAWKENSRVKKLKMYVDNIPIAFLNLEDTRKEQHFKFEPLGNGNRNDWNQLLLMPWWSIKFEIIDVYKGEKYDDTAITEIYFDGIDVH